MNRHKNLWCADVSNWLDPIVDVKLGNDIFRYMHGRVVDPIDDVAWIIEMEAFNG
jgi:hypothetical protein